MKNILLSITQKFIHNKLLFLSLLGVICIPLIYGGLYLWAFWDPYAGMSHVSVAVVNEDKGEQKDDELQNYGNDLVEKLENDENLDWQFVSRSQANIGLEDLTYPAVLYINENFTSALLSVDTDEPYKAQLVLKVRETNSFFSSKYIKAVINEIAKKLKIEVETEYFDNIFMSLQDVSSGLVKGADGAFILADGLDIAEDGSFKLKDGLIEAKDGLSDLTAGLVSLFDGSKTLRDKIILASDGAKDLKEGIYIAKTGSNDIATGSAALEEGLLSLKTSSEDLNSGSAQLLVGASQIELGLNQLSIQTPSLVDNLNNLNQNLEQTSLSLNEIQTNISQLASGTQDSTLSAQLNEYGATLSQIKTEVDAMSTIAATLYSASQTIRDAISQLASVQSIFVTNFTSFQSGFNQFKIGLSLVFSKMQLLTAGAIKLDAGMTDIESGIVSLQDGLTQLADGSIILADKLETAHDGSIQIEDGMQELADGSQDLSEGLTEAKDGSHELANSLADGSIELKDKTQQSIINSQVPVLADPISVEIKTLSPVVTNGIGFAGYFIPLSLWVGAMAIFFVVKMPDKIQKTSFMNWVQSLRIYGLSLVVAVLQAWVLPYFLIHQLGLPTIYRNRLYFYCVLLSI